MNREELELRIYTYLISNCPVTDRSNTLNTTTRQDFENRIYTKKKPLSLDYQGYSIQMISISSDTQDFSGALKSDVRIGFLNGQGAWCNLFLDEVPDDLVQAIHDYLDRTPGVQAPTSALELLIKRAMSIIPEHILHTPGVLAKYMTLAEAEDLACIFESVWSRMKEEA